MLPRIGQSRTSIQARHALLTPESYDRITMPGRPGSELVHLLPRALGARLLMYLVEASADLTLPAQPEGVRRFLLVLEPGGEVEEAGRRTPLGREDYVFLPEPQAATVRISAGAKLVVFEWDRSDLTAGDSLPLVSGNVANVAGQPLKGDDALMVQNLLPKDERFDAEVNVMNFAPGASLPYVETHFMEHGLLFLDGEGIYRLGERWYPVV